ncbi:NAD(P)-dependent oxidoreductase [Fulvivirga sp.]|uniref:SDR family oxidoreductase n=3 Tax=Fulvivirga sp. TaxID=1931237 RepID=UPI0032EFC2D8
MRILITGSNGLLGQKLIKLLCDEEVEVIATSRGSNRLPNDGQYQYESLDIVNQQQVLDVVSKYKPDVIINTAAMTNVDQCETEKEACWELNVNAVKYLIEACEVTGTHLLHISTDFIFDGSHGPLTEEEAPNPISYYGESKLAAEKLVIESKIKWSIARTVLVYGIAHDMSRSNIVLWVKNSLEAGKAINVVNDQWRTPTLAEDLAMGCYLIASQSATGIYNISGEELMTPYDIAIKTAEYFQLNKSLISETDGSKFSQPAKRPPKTGFIIDKAKTKLGYSPKSFEEGLRVLASQLD